MIMTPEQEQKLLARLESVEDAIEHELVEAKQQRRQIMDDVKCIKTTWDEFQDRHGQLLDLLLEREQTRKKLNTAIIEKSLAGVIWSILIFVSVASLEWAKNHILYRIFLLNSSAGRSLGLISMGGWFT